MAPAALAHAVKVNLTAGRAARATAQQNRSALQERNSSFMFTATGSSVTSVVR
jgi:hypothetical protein